MSTIAFIGLGIMGRPMAANLVASGHDVTGFDLHEGNLAELVVRGGHRSSTIAECVQDAAVIITMVPDSPNVESAALGPNGIYANCRRDALHIDCSTIRPDVARSVASAGAAMGVRVLDAPVSGGEIGAVEGTLSIMVGGSEDAFAAALPILKAIGSTIVRVGGAGAGQIVKAANQLIVAGTIELVAEAIVFLEAYDVNLERAIDVLAGGLAGNAILDRKVNGMLRRDFQPGFRIDLHHKDLGILEAAARDAGVIIPLGTHVASLIASLKAQGHGQLDHSALLLLVEQLSGRTSKTSEQVTASAASGGC